MKRPLKAPLLPALLETGTLPMPLPAIDPRKVLVETWFRGKDPKTVRAYELALRHFAEWISEWLKSSGLLKSKDLGPDQAAQAFLAAGQGQANLLAINWKDALQKKGYAAATINSHMTALRSLVKVARVIGLVPWALDIPNVQSQPYRNTEGPGSEAFGKVMATLDARTDQKSVRDRTLLAMVHDGAFRRSEASLADLKDVDWAQSRVWVKAKMRSQPVPIPLSPDTMRRLGEWIRVRGEEAGPLFTNFDRARKGGGRLSGGGMWRIVTAYGLGRIHGIRHLAITEALEATNGNVSETMKFSRHKDPKTLMIYDDNRKNVSGTISAKISEIRNQ